MRNPQRITTNSAEFFIFLNILAHCFGFKPKDFTLLSQICFSGVGGDQVSTKRVIREYLLAFTRRAQTF